MLPPAFKNAAERILQAFAVMGLLVDANIGNQAEHRASPIGASPGRGAIETLVAGLGFAFRHIAYHVMPHCGRRELAGLNASDGLDIGGNAFFNPVMLLGHGGEREVDHFVGEHPVGVEV